MAPPQSKRRPGGGGAAAITGNAITAENSAKACKMQAPGAAAAQVTPSDEQAAVIRQVKDWHNHRTRRQQVFRLFGYAGTGKTTIAVLAIAELGLDGDDVLYAAYTGKAALVMSRKGTPASTIHSLIYHVSEATPEEIERVKREIAAISDKLSMLDSSARQLEEARLRSLQLRLADLRQPRFILNDKSAVRDAKLIVLDEVSMVPDGMAADLLAFGKPILVLGDPGQLPPINGEGAFTTNAAPDVMLIEIQRQAGESPIIRLATMARQRQQIPHGKFDDEGWVAKVRRADMDTETLLSGDQVICGMNATRFRLNTQMKHSSGFPETYPIGAGEKIICLKNRNDLGVAGIVNGQFLQLRDVQDENDICFSADITTEDGHPIGGQSIYRGHFDDHVKLDRERDDRDYWIKKSLIEAVWGYAITCHKSQGSQWGNVIVIDDGWGRTAEQRSQWLYTAITRAERGLWIYG